MGEKFKACKQAKFPICLEKSLDALFQHYSQNIISIACKSGFRAKPVISSKDVWEMYLDILSFLETTIGASTIGVIESRVLKEMETMKCEGCPLYELESLRKAQKYSEPLADSAKFIRIREEPS